MLIFFFLWRSPSIWWSSGSNIQITCHQVWLDWPWAQSLCNAIQACPLCAPFSAHPRPLWCLVRISDLEVSEMLLRSGAHRCSSEVGYLPGAPSPLWSQHFSVPRGLLLRSFCQKAGALVSLLGLVLPARMLQSAAKWWEYSKKEKKGMGIHLKLLGP